MPKGAFESVAGRYEEAVEMDLAREILRSRALASRGHLCRARYVLDDLASMHAVRSHP